MFIGFDLEEAGLFGSRYFVAHSPVPLERVVAFHHRRHDLARTGRRLRLARLRHGQRECPGPAPLDRAKPARGRALSVDLLGADLLVLNRSDYGPFRSRAIPFLFFTTGENPRYHTSDDTPETLDYPKLTAISRMIGQVVRKAARGARGPPLAVEPRQPVCRGRRHPRGARHSFEEQREAQDRPRRSSS